MTSKNPRMHSKCVNGDRCVGPGCKVKTGKTARKGKGK